MSEIKGTLLKDSNGNISSKRVAGFIGLILTCAIAAYAVYHNDSAVKDVMWPLCVLVGACFGVTVLEKKK